MTDDNATCNQCGEVIIERVSGYPIQVGVSGGYQSNIIFDGNYYGFTLCESCLVGIMQTLKVPPHVIGHDGTPVTWAEDRAQIKERDQRDFLAKLSLDTAIRNNVCTERDAYKVECCGALSVASVDGEPICSRHLRDIYAVSCSHTHVVIDCDGRKIEREEMCRIGREFIAHFRGGGTNPPAPRNRHDSDLWISTLFSHLLEPAYAKKADLWLAGLLDGFRPDPVKTWIDARVPIAFTPEDVSHASRANDWLTWGRETGYLNGVAHALLGRDPESLWE